MLLIKRSVAAECDTKSWRFQGGYRALAGGLVEQEPRGASRRQSLRLYPIHVAAHAQCFAGALAGRLLLQAARRTRPFAVSNMQPDR